MRFADAFHNREYGSSDEANSNQGNTRGVSAEEGQKDAAETILLVEDNEFVRSVISEVLDSAGFQLQLARNAEEALLIAGNCVGIDLLITDVVMPGMNGRELAVKFEDLFPRAKALLISGYPKKTLTNSENIAIESYLAKPFTAEMLLQRVREVLSVNTLISCTNRRSFCDGAWLEESHA